MNEASTIDCGDVRELIPDLVADRLPITETARALGHLERCADCRAELELVRLLYASRAQVPPGLLDRIGRASLERPPARTGWGISAAAIAAFALGIGIVSEDAPATGGAAPAFVREAEEGEIWLSDDGLVAGAPALDGLSDEALLELSDELTTVSTGGGA